MGLFDKLKDVAGGVAEAATNPVSTLKTAATPVTKPAGWAWNNTIGELGDRDYTPFSETDVAGARQTQETQQDLLFGQPADSLPSSGPGPLGQQALQWAGDRGIVPGNQPSRNELTDLVAAGRDMPETFRMAAHTRGYDVGGNELSPMVWQWNAENRMRTEAEEQLNEQITTRLDSDWEALVEQQGDKVEDWRMLSMAVVQVMENARDDEGNIIDEDTWLSGQALLNMNYEELSPHVEVMAPGWWDENFEFYDGPSQFARTAGGIAQPILEALDLTSQTVLRGIAATARGDVFDQQFWTKGGAGAGYEYGGEDGRLSYAEALYGEERAAIFDEAAGEWADIINLAGEIAIDPLTYVTLGQTQAVRASIRGTAKHALADATEEGTEAALKRHAAVWTIIHRDGMGALLPDELLDFQRWVKNDAWEVAARQNAGLTGKARETWAKLSQSSLDDIARMNKKAQDLAEKNLEKISRGGQQGLGMGGVTVIPTRFGTKYDYAIKRALVDKGRKQTVGHMVDGGFDEIITPRTRIVGEEIIEEATDPRVSKLRAKAASTQFPHEAEAFMKKADEIAGGAATYQNIRYIDDIITERIARDPEWVEDIIPLLDEKIWREIDKITPGKWTNFREGVPWLRSRFVPRANLQLRIGRAQEQAVRMKIIEAQATANTLSKSVTTRLQSKLGKLARKEWGSDEEFMRSLNEALSSTGDMARVRLQGGVKTNQLLDALEEIREDVWNTLDDEQKALFGNKDSYIPRVMDKKGRTWLENLSPEDMVKLKANAPELFALAQEAQMDRAVRLQQKSLNDAFTEARSVAPGIQNLFELNDELRAFLKDMDISMTDDLFSTDVLANWTTRADSAYRSKVMGEIVESMAMLTDEAGDRLAVHANSYRQHTGSKLNLVAPNRHDFGDYYLHKDLVGEFEKINSVLLDPNKLDQLGKVTDHFQSMWARYATLSPGFHSRNAIGNVFNAFLGGVQNPVRYADAAFLQMQDYRVAQLMKRDGLNWDNAAQRLGVSSADQLVLKDMKRFQISGGLVGDIFKDKDLEKFSLAEMRDFTSVSKANPTTWSRNVGTMIEHNARMAMYMDAIYKGMSPSAAATHVKEFLFDYDDLTQFESNVRRHLSRFYTFMRKNTALQANMLVRAPGRIVNAQKIAEQATNMVFGDPDEEASLALPSWAQVAGMRQREGGAIGVETPFFSAMNTVEDVMALPLALAEMSGIPLDKMPDSMQNAIMYNGVQDRVGQSLGLFSGLPKATADFLYGQTTGYDPFTGAIVGYDNPRKQDDKYPWPWLGMVAVANPFVDRAIRWMEDGEKIAAGEQDLGLTLWNVLGGVQVYEDDRIHNSAVNTLRINLEEAMRNQKEELGDGFMNEDELRRQGRIDYVNRFMHIMAYGGVDPEGLASDDELANELAGLIPKEILEYYTRRGQLDPNLVEDREYSTELRPQEEMERALAALPEVKGALEELLGRDLNQQEEINLLLTSDMAPYMAQLESFGIEPFRDQADPTRNQFIDIPEGQEEREVRTTIDQLGASFGIDFDTLLSSRPMLSDMARRIEQAKYAGASEEEIFQMTMEESSRLDINVMFGKETLSEFNWGGFDQRDAQRQINAAWEDRAKFIWTYEYVNGQAPSQAEINRAVIHMNIGRTDQRYLLEQGLISDLGPYPPSRENIQSKGEQQQDAVTQLGSVLEGAEGNRFMGQYAEPDERKSIELGGADWLYGENRFAEAPNYQDAG